MFFPYYNVKCLEKMIALEKNYRNNHTHITQVTQTDWLIYHTLYECSATAQAFLKLLFEFILCLLSSFHHFPRERIGCWF